jgi:regulator of sirC expression with transglutaminase-like and TPR domain
VFERIEKATGQKVQLAEPVLTKATHRQWLGRMLNNLQAVFASKGRERDLHAMQELQQLLS